MHVCKRVFSLSSLLMVFFWFTLLNVHSGGCKWVQHSFYSRTKVLKTTSNTDDDLHERNECDYARHHMVRTYFEREWVSPIWYVMLVLFLADFFFCTNSLYKLLLVKCDQRLKTIFLSFFFQFQLKEVEMIQCRVFFNAIYLFNLSRGFLCHWLHTFESHIAMHFIYSYVWSWRLERYIF